MNLPTANDLAAYPGLIPWLVSRNWITEFDLAVLKKATGLPVNSIQLRDGAPDDGENDSDLLVQARVKDSAPKPYQTKLFLFFEYDHRTRRQTVNFASECSCFDSYNCRHAVAVLDALTSIAAAPPVMNAPQVSAALAAWLRRIKEAGTVTKTPAKPAKPYTKFLAYCIEPSPYAFYGEVGKPNFSTRIGNQNKTGVSIESSVANADPSRAPRYMATEDMLICAKFQQRNRKLHLWGGAVPLEGADWDDILEPALATGRLFHAGETETIQRTKDYTRLEEGPPFTIEASWDILPGGQARPVLRLPSLEIQVIPTDPLRYVDPQNHQFGRLQSHLPAAMLLAWATGPTVPAANIHDLNLALVSLSPENPLPLPAEKPARAITGLAPTPVPPHHQRARRRFPKTPHRCPPEIPIPR